MRGNFGPARVRAAARISSKTITDIVTANRFNRSPRRKRDRARLAPRPQIVADSTQQGDRN